MLAADPVNWEGGTVVGVVALLLPVTAVAFEINAKLAQVILVVLAKWTTIDLSMLCGKFPFYESTPAALFRKIRAADYTIPS